MNGELHDERSQEVLISLLGRSREIEKKKCQSYGFFFAVKSRQVVNDSRADVLETVMEQVHLSTYQRRVFPQPATIAVSLA